MRRTYRYGLAAFLSLLAVGVVFYLVSAKQLITVAFPIVTTPTLQIAVNHAHIETEPGVTQRLVYRVTNPNTQPQRLLIKLEYEPEEAEEQLRIFETDCRKWILIQPGETLELETVFALLPAGFGSAKHLTLRSIFQTL